MKPRLAMAITAIFCLALIFVFPQIASNFYISLLNDIGIAALVVIGLVLVSGIGGAMSFGQAAFVGIAAYTSAWLTVNIDVSPWIALLVALVFTCGSALVLGLVTMRLGGHYLALSTIAWGLAVPLVFSNVSALGSHSGIDGIPPLVIGAWSLRKSSAIFIPIWLTVFFGGWFAHNLLRSRVGRTIRALRGGKVLMASFGVNASNVRLTLFVLAAAYAALAGWLYAHTNRFVSATPFGLHASIEYFFMMVIGSMSQLSSAFLGSTFYIGLSNWLQDVLPYFTDRGAQIHSLVFAIIFLIVLQRMPGGFGQPLTQLLGRYWRVTPASLKTTSQVKPLAVREKPAAGSLLLETDNVVRTFGGLVAVNNVSFEIRAGEILALIGPNGAGKTTMFNLITGTLPLSNGAVRFQNQVISGLSQREIARRGIARTFQHVKLRPQMNLLENVALGAHARGRCGLIRGGLALDKQEETVLLSEAMRQLERVGLAEQAFELAGSLSLGSQRLLEIARALAADPILLILDEPAAGLRHHEKQALAKLLDTLRSEGVTVLIVEHDMEFVMNLVDRLVVMNFGSKIAEGKPEEVRANPQVQAAYLGVDE